MLDLVKSMKINIYLNTTLPSMESSVSVHRTAKQTHCACASTKNQDMVLWCQLVSVMFLFVCH
jgi:hypothetical protein